jgi:hypothetical protein
LRIGPVTLKNVGDTYLDVTRLTLQSNLPWHVLYTHRRKQIVVEEQDDIPTSRYWPAVGAVVMKRHEPWYTRRYLPHELGHAIEQILFTTNHDRQQLHNLMHQGNTPAGCNGGNWFSNFDQPGSHVNAPGEAAAEYVAYMTGVTEQTQYGPHSWHGIWADRIRDLFWQKAETMTVFNDVPANHPHATAIHRLAAEGIIGGFPDGNFKPSEPVTRAQLATIINRILDRQK